MDNAMVPPAINVRNSLPQICAVGSINILMMGYGITLGYSTILISELQRQKIIVSLDELTWISSVSFITLPAGSLTTGVLFQWIGRKTLLLFATIPFVLAWILLYYAWNATTLLVGLGTLGFCCGLSENTSILYSTEVTQPHLRGVLNATTGVSVTVGILVGLLLSTSFTCRITAAVSTTCPALVFVAFCFMPETPAWLVSKGRLKQAETALCWLRGQVSPTEVQKEFEILCKLVQKSNSDSSKWSINRLKPFFQKSFYRPVIVVSVVFLISYVGGSMVLQMFAVMVFQQLNSPIDTYNATLIFGAAELVGILICACAIKYTGKRKLAFISFGMNAAFLFCISVHVGLVQYEVIDRESNTWIPTTLFISASLFGQMGPRTLPWMILGEVIPLRTRNVGSSCLISIAYITMSLTNKGFLYILSVMKIYGTFLFFAAINFLGCITIFFILPETEGKTHAEIEEYFREKHFIKWERIFKRNTNKNNTAVNNSSSGENREGM